MGDFDEQLDESNVMVGATFYCAKCTVTMKALGGNRYQCPKCGQMFEDK